MKILSIDIETTGIDPETCKVIELGAVCYDTEKKSIISKNWIIKHPVYSGSAFALHLNSRIFGELSKKDSTEEIEDIEFIAQEFSRWLKETCENTLDKDLKVKIQIVAGKNFG